MGLNAMFNRGSMKLALQIQILFFIHLLGLGIFLYSTKRYLSTDWGISIIVVGLIITFLFLSVFSLMLIKRTMWPLHELTDLLKDLCQGFYWRRMYPKHQSDALAGLISYANQLATQLQQTTENQHMNEDRLQTLIRHMASGLLFINQFGRIILINDKLKRMLSWEQNHEQKLYYESPLPEDVTRVVHQTFDSEKESRQDITIQSGIERLEIKLYAAPVKDSHEKVTGVVLVFHDISDLKNLEQIRKDFVANVSHELKTPLTSIKGFSETLLDGAMHSEKHLKQFLEIIRQESDRLNRLIQDLLELSHIEQRSFILHWEKVPLNTLIKDTILLVKSKAEEKHITLTCDYLEDALIEGDSDRLRQVFLNLISNAIQYTAEQGLVQITLSKWEEKGYRVCVTDNGVGIKKEEIPRLFERFYRVDKARSRVSGGTGLGLAIVKHLVEAHEGEIEVSSEEGKGSCFCICLHKDRREKQK